MIISNAAVRRLAAAQAISATNEVDSPLALNGRAAW